jgi:hypothetical protein
MIQYEAIKSTFKHQKIAKNVNFHLYLQRISALILKNKPHETSANSQKSW